MPFDDVPARPGPGEVLRMQRLWQAVLVATLEEMTEDRARRYLESQDGRMVRELAGVEVRDPRRLNMRAFEQRRARRFGARG